MSNFNCDICGLPILEGSNGEYITGCSHYPLEKLPKKERITITTHFKLPTINIEVVPNEKGIKKGKGRKGNKVQSKKR